MARRNRKFAKRAAVLSLFVVVLFAGTIAFYVVAGLALAVGIALGTTVSVADLSHPVHEQLHAAHVHANVLGWIGLTVLGTLFTLWPTVLRTSRRPPCFCTMP